MSIYEQVIEEENKRMIIPELIPHVLSQREVEEKLEVGVTFDHKPDRLEEIHRKVQCDSDVAFFSGYLSPEQVRERERKLLKKIEDSYPQVVSSKIQKWWQAIKEETEKE
jgi:hypothetical protein